MIRGSFAGPPGRRRPQVVAHVTAEPDGTAEEVTFLIDTGADRTLLSTADAEALGLELSALPAGRSVGIGGAAATVLATVVIGLGARHFRATLRVLAGATEGQARIPSVLGGDILAYFGLYLEEGRDLVLLLEPGEAGTLPVA